MRNFGGIEKWVKVNIADEESVDGGFGWLRRRMNPLREDRASEKENAKRQEMLSSGGAELAGCEIAFHRRSLVEVHSFMRRIWLRMNQACKKVPKSDDFWRKQRVLGKKTGKNVRFFTTDSLKEI